jgi:hypothetical protein
MDWYRRIQFVSAVPMPAEQVEAYGTTVNGMWADPDRFDPEDIEREHERGRRVLFSVPLIALEPRVYERDATNELVDEVCADIAGERSECDWYFWESKPVYAACIYSAPFRSYLMARCRDGVDRGTDVVNLDEIMTSVGLMGRRSRNTGFCSRCLERFRGHLREDEEPDLTALDDEGLRGALRADDDLYERYRRFHEVAAFEVMVGFIDELRAYASPRNPDFAISANVAYLGNLVPVFGPLWGCMWGTHVDLVLMENHYRVQHDAPHQVLPRGSFAAWYRLGTSLNGSPTWICPSITVPRQLADRPRTNYHLLMFLESYANAGRWGYYWWPGVDAATRLAATAPESLKTWIRFIDEHRELYEGAAPVNDLAILYADGAISGRPETHVKYLALAQALAERGFQFDVLYGGDGRFNPDELDPEMLGHYRAILLPEAQALGPSPAAALESFARGGGNVVVFSESPLAPDRVRRARGDILTAFWRDYLDDDRERILAELVDVPVARIESSDAAVRVTRFAAGDRQVFHLLDLGYEQATDAITPIRDLRLRIPWSSGAVSCTVVTLDGEGPLDARVLGGELHVEVPEVDPYAVLVVTPEARP